MASRTNTTLSKDSPFTAADYVSDSKVHVLFCCSGSVATIKAPVILQALSTHPALSIRVILTSSAAQFLAGQSSEQPTVSSLLSIPNVDGIYHDADEWHPPWTRGAPILHIELRRWADVCVVAPLSANTLAKMVNGISDGLLTSVLRAWDTTGMIDSIGGKKKRVLVAPAMNTAMWLHPVTARQLKVLDEWNAETEAGGGEWVEVLRPKEGALACGDVGIGAMMNWEEIVDRTLAEVNKTEEWKGLKKH